LKSSNKDAAGGVGAAPACDDIDDKKINRSISPCHKEVVFMSFARRFLFNF
jgi:hypothetical protein